MVLIAVTQVPDPRGTLRWLVSEMDGRITMSMEGALLKIAHAAREMQGSPGQTFEVPVKVSRYPKLAQPAVLELRVPDNLAGQLSAEALTVPPGEDQATLRIVSTAGPRLVGPQTVTIRATAMQPQNLPVISETSLEIEFVSAGQ